MADNTINHQPLSTINHGYYHGLQGLVNGVYQVYGGYGVIDLNG